MSPFSAFNPTHLVSAYGYAAVALVVGFESMGLPLPGETVLVTAAVYAGSTHRLNIAWIICAAASGAVIGDNAGFWIGRRLGFPLLKRYGPRFGVDERRLKIGRYLFDRHGGAVVFFGRFVALLRAVAALLAGANGMPWRRFFTFNAGGGVLWAMLYGVGGYVLGALIQRIASEAGLALAGLGVLAIVFGLIVVRRSEAQLAAKAERAYPGPLASPAPIRRRG